MRTILLIRQNWSYQLGCAARRFASSKRKGKAKRVQKHSEDIAKNEKASDSVNSSSSGDLYGSRKAILSNDAVSDEEHATGFMEYMFDKYGDELKKLSANLMEHVRNDRIGFLKSNSQRQQIVDCLRSALVGQSDRLVVPVGSSASGLAGQKSDIDVVLISSQDAEKRRKIMENFESEKFRIEYMRKVESLVKKHDRQHLFDWTKAVKLWKVRVPVIRLYTKVGIDVDIQFDNEHSIRNTNFVRHCVQEDIRVSLLNAWTQRWMMAIRLKNSRMGMFSSYHTTMLVIHFLECAKCAQGCNVLPVIYELYANNLSRLVPLDRVARMIDEPLKYAPLRNDSSPTIAELLVQFVDFYSKIDFHEWALSVETGQLLQRNDDSRDMLMLYDPYSNETVCHVRAGADRLMQAFSITKQAISSGQGLNWPMRLRK